MAVNRPVRDFLVYAIEAYLQCLIDDGTLCYIVACMGNRLVDDESCRRICDLFYWSSANRRFHRNDGKWKISDESEIRRIIELLRSNSEWVKDAPNPRGKMKLRRKWRKLWREVFGRRDPGKDPNYRFWPWINEEHWNRWRALWSPQSIDNPHD